eukprot:Nk52_evm53s2309 gene=Nk52_evmTU53s2309
MSGNYERIRESDDAGESSSLEGGMHPDPQSSLSTKVLLRPLGDRESASGSVLLSGSAGSINRVSNLEESTSLLQASDRSCSFDHISMNTKAARKKLKYGAGWRGVLAVMFRPMLILLCLICIFILMDRLNRQNLAKVRTPIFLLHGLGDNETDWTRGNPSYVQMINNHIPEATIYNIPLFGDAPEDEWPDTKGMNDTIKNNCEDVEHIQQKNNSYVPLWIQVKYIVKYIRKTVEEGKRTEELREKGELSFSDDTPVVSFKSGYHLVCHSQGGLICRAILQVMKDHDVRTFISLAGVLLGAHDEPLFPETIQEVTGHSLYSHYTQRCLSMANFYNNPKQRSSFLKYNSFLPYLNNELSKQDMKAMGKLLEEEIYPEKTGKGGEYDPRTSLDLNPSSFSRNLNRVRRMILFASPDDEWVNPYLTSVFGYEDDQSKAIPQNETLYFKKDTFGLRRLFKSGKLITNMIPGVKHAEWMNRDDIFMQYMYEYLL